MFAPDAAPVVQAPPAPPTWVSHVVDTDKKPAVTGAESGAVDAVIAAWSKK
ncbi:MAG: hypothetical protein KF773_02820 [Deltaproteobacteria bacterium]|nr:hypothetical protein [Deltaproteobacteria bacterium]